MISNDGVATGEMLAEAVKDRRCLRGGEHSAFSAAGDGGGNFDSSNACDVNSSGRAVARNSANPEGADLRDVTFHQPARIDEGRRHR